MKRWHWYLIGLVVVLIALFLFGWKAASILGGIGAGGYTLLSDKIKEDAKEEEKVAEEIKEQTKENEKTSEQLEKEEKEREQEAQDVIDKQDKLRKEKEELDDKFNDYFKG